MKIIRNGNPGLGVHTWMKAQGKEGFPYRLRTAPSARSYAEVVSQNYTLSPAALSSSLRKQLINEHGGLREALIFDVN